MWVQIIDPKNREPRNTFISTQRTAAKLEMSPLVTGKKKYYLITDL